jgi:hypothetical protein
MFKKKFGGGFKKNNVVLNKVETQNKHTTAIIDKFRRSYRQGLAKFSDFSKLKHKYPYYGFVPCY